ncbi:hypothetical protein [Streptacidiphilus jiangxiensis]|uniref:Leucine rich repeat variant n=1 Tax=Streptacidiphilus jiangxiensis TaxID=235985 RepID=A0A1H7V791_STRJI|nr:hypothetical protein [Streptacidiphilus jiangxiensis]SEM05083.1 hypothetical protein SAMN05414137_117136 [Streptacidiphilus jiangxiensis]
MRRGGAELTALLEQAGLEKAGQWRTEAMLPPSAAWRLLAGAGADAPVVTVPGPWREAAASVNQAWERLTREAGVPDAEGVFLVDLGGPWAARRPRHWTRVRLTDTWDLAGVLGEEPGGLEFVTASPGGDMLVAVVSGADAVRLTVVDRLRERLDAAAEAAARASEAEQAAAWAALEARAASETHLPKHWIEGLNANPSLPQELRARLLAESRHAMWRPLPAEEVEAVLNHPDWKVRAFAAEVQPNITPEQWERLILGEEDARRRWALTTLAVDRKVVLPQAVLRRLAADPSARVRAEALGLQGVSAETAAGLVDDPDTAVRRKACAVAWPELSETARAALRADPEPRVRRDAVLRHHREHPLSRADFEGEQLDAQDLENCRLARDLVEWCLGGDDVDRRRALARNGRLEPEFVARLAQDPDPGVRLAVSVRPELTEDQRAAVVIEFDPGQRSYGLPWVMALHDDVDAMRRLAASTHPLIRRSVARARRLPADVVALLADDEDRVVQLFLAESCDDAPAEMLLRVCAWWSGSFSSPGRPRSHPNFPRTGLLHYADDPNPRLRRLALDDPESTPELVERFTRDLDGQVRHRAAEDERLSAAAAARLADDPEDSVRFAALRHPGLPATVLAERLGTCGDAEWASRNPAVPVAVLRVMADRAVPTPPAGGAAPA